MKAVVAAFNQEKALVGAFSVITNLRTEFGCNFSARPSVMYSYNLAYKDEPDDLMFPMEEDEVARRSGAFKSADCFCCSSSIPSAALVTGSLKRRKLNLFSTG